MWARVSTYEGPPENIDQAMTYAREQLLPKLSDVAGYRGVYALADRQSGKTISITLWDSEEDLRASEAEADRMRADSAGQGDATVAGVERYEVAFHDLT